MKITSKHLCTAATIVYHCLFLSGASFYVTEFQKTRDVIVKQVDRVENESKKLRREASSVRTSIIGLSIKIDSVGVELGKVKNTCSKFNF